jgi:CheY-like chemotaxis protein
MGLMSLIYSRDERAIKILGLLLSELEIKTEHANTLAQAQESIARQKYDGVFAECETEDGAILLRTVRKSKHNRRSIVFALSATELKMNAAFELGAHFVLQKPLAVEKVKRTLKAAHGLMMREQRTHYRHPTSSKIMVKTAGGKTVTAWLKDLSQGGALIDSDVVLRKDQPISLRFTLPDTSITVEVEGKTTRSDPTGLTGVKFGTLSEATQKQLVEWVIARSMDVEKPPTTSIMAAAAVAEITASTEPSEMMDLEVEVIEPDEDVRVRKTLRGEHHASVKLLAFEHGRPVIVSGKCANLNEVGMAAELEEDLMLDGPVLLQVEMARGMAPLVIHAEFRQKDGRRYGFEFVSVSDEAQQILRQTVESLPVEE